MYAIAGEDADTYNRHIDAVVATNPQIIMDDGADLDTALHTRFTDKLAGVIGGTEETTTGVVRLAAMAAEGTLGYPVFNINDANTKHCFDNHYGTGQSTLDGIVRATNRLLCGRTIVISGYGYCGSGLALRATGLGMKVIAYDPFTKPETAAELGVTMKSLNDVFAEADVVSCHTPWLKETENMIRGEHFKLMKPNATFINTARGAVIAEEEMLDVMEARPDLTAVLDVTYPEPPKPGSRIYTLPNVILTPHVAGSMAAECRRMGRYAVEMCQCYLAGKPMKWQLNKKMAETMA